MICYLFPEPTYFFFTPDAPALLYYVYIPTTVIALLFGFYVFWNNKHSLLNQLLFSISLAFSLWTIATLIEWTNIHSDLIIFSWSFLSVILGLMAILCIYFIYVFLDKKDISVRTKVIFLALLAPILLLTSTSLSLSGFNLTDCDAFKFENLPFKIYYTSLGVLAMVWILILLIRKFRVATPDLRKQIVLMGIGIEVFLFLFYIWIFVADYMTRIGVFPDSQIEIYGLLGVVIFMIYISILIVRFKAFNGKLFTTQVLVWGLVILVGSEFFTAQTNTNKILIAVTLTISAWLGLIIIRSVKKEITQREQLAKLNIQLEDSIKQRESLVHLVTHKVKGSFTRTKYLFVGMLDGTFGEISPEIRKRAEQGLEFDNGGIETADVVLKASNLSSGTVKYDMQVIDLKDIVQKIIEEKKIPAQNKGLKMESGIKDDKNVYNILGDATWIREVVNNLVENSIRYTKEGTITVGLERKPASMQGGNEKILFYVKDTGMGITDEDKKGLFTEGGRGKDSIRVNVDSTGYGLYSVKLIIEAHKGRVWVDSEVGKGSTFYVELDAVKKA